MSGKKYIIAGFLTVLMWKAVPAQHFSWSTISSKLGVTGAAAGENRVCFSTEGGLLEIDASLQQIKSFTKTEGLAEQHMTAVAADRRGNIWCGYYHGYLQYLEYPGGEWRTIDDYFGYSVHAIDPAGDSLFIGLDIGVSLYVISRDEVKETYRHLGEAFDRDIPVIDVVHTEEYIWAATAQGVSRAPLDAVNMLDPRTWTDVTLGTGLEGADIHDLLITGQGTVYAASDNGVFRWNDGTWEQESARQIHSLAALDSGLYGADDTALYFRSSGTWEKIEGSPSHMYAVAGSQESIWGVSGSAVWQYTPGNTVWGQYTIDCIQYDLITGCYRDSHERDWVCSRGGGFFSKRDSGWVPFNEKLYQDIWSDEAMCVTEDDSGIVWIGTWGGGLYSVDTTDSISRFHPENNYLAGVSENYNYCVVPAIVRDMQGAVWLLNYRSVQGLPLVSIYNDNFTYFGAPHGITSTFLKAIAVDYLDRKWVGSEDRGVFVYDDFRTPDDPSDDYVFTITTQNGLESNTISSIACSSDGTVWIGTPKGLYSVFSTTASKVYGAVSENIKALAVDGADNLWVGTDSGLNLFMQDDYSWHLFTAENSFLVSNDISSLYFHPDAGKLYVSTSSGVSVIQTTFSRPLDELSDIEIYPNPFNLNIHENAVVNNLSDNSIVAIYTASGYLVKVFNEKDVPGRQISWDGRDQAGNSVSSGIYIVVARDDRGGTARGRVAVVR